MRTSCCVATAGFDVFVGRGGQNPSPVPLVTIEIQTRNPAGGLFRMELTQGQAQAVISHLQAAIAPAPDNEQGA